MNAFPFISVLTAVPLIGAFGILCIGAQNRKLARGVALAFSFIALALTLILWHRFDPASVQLQFEELHAWIPAIGVQYHVGIDGLGLLMLLLSAIVVPMSIAASWEIQERTPLYFSLVLFLQAGLFGTFTALNFFHWFIFWELSLIPAFFLIRLWGGPKRGPAATQFFVYTMVGSVALLLAFLAIFQCTGKFDFIDLSELARNGQLIPALVGKLGWHTFGVGTDCADYLLWSVSRLRGEGAADSIPHLAAFGLCRSAHRHDDAAHRRDVEDGRLWLPADSASHLLSGDAICADAAAVARRGDDYSLRLCRIRAERFEANACVLVDQSPRLLHARNIFGGKVHR